MTSFTIDSLATNEGFHRFISRFDKPVREYRFPDTYIAKRAPKSFLEKLDDKEARNIMKRQRIRDNIYLDYKFDIFELPFLVYYQESGSEQIEPFKTIQEAKGCCGQLKERGTDSFLIMIMNHDIECIVYSNES